MHHAVPVKPDACRAPVMRGPLAVVENAASQRAKLPRELERVDAALVVETAPIKRTEAAKDFLRIDLMRLSHQCWSPVAGSLELGPMRAYVPSSASGSAPSTGRSPCTTSLATGAKAPRR